MDSLHFTLEMPIDPEENIYSIKLFLLFDIKLHVSTLFNLEDFYKLLVGNGNEITCGAHFISFTFTVQKDLMGESTLMYPSSRKKNRSLV